MAYLTEFIQNISKYLNQSLHLKFWNFNPSMAHPFLQPQQGGEREDDDLYELSGSDDDRLRHEYELINFENIVVEFT